MDGLHYTVEGQVKVNRQNTAHDDRGVSGKGTVFMGHKNLAGGTAGNETRFSLGDTNRKSLRNVKEIVDSIHKATGENAA